MVRQTIVGLSAVFHLYTTIYEQKIRNSFEPRILIVCSARAADILITQLLESQLLVQPQLPSSSYDE